MAICKNCSQQGTGRYCASCGQLYEVKRITVSSIIHEVTHLFTHMDKGFLYTLKQLAVRRGKMQKNYLQGERSKHQKPFSLFFICATLAGLAIYWITKPSSLAEVISFDEREVDYYRHYYVLTQTALSPFCALLLWLFFRNKNFNYAEALVLYIYSFAFSLLLIILINTLNLIPGHIDTPYIEIPLLGIYIIWTNLNFFNNQPAWSVIIKSLIVLMMCWLTSYFITEQIIHRMM